MRTMGKRKICPSTTHAYLVAIGLLIICFVTLQTRSSQVIASSCPDKVVARAAMSAVHVLARGKRVLVTGIAGFIGSHVAKSCVDLGLTVIGVDDLSGGFKKNVPKALRLSSVT